MTVIKSMSENTLENVERILQAIKINTEKFERSDAIITSKALNTELFNLYRELCDFSLVLIDELEYLLEKEEEIIDDEEEDF